MDPQRAPYTGPAEVTDDAADSSDAMDVHGPDATADGVDDADGLEPEDTADTRDGQQPDGFDGLAPEDVAQDVEEDVRDVGPDVPDGLDVPDVSCDPPECGERECGLAANACGETVECGDCADDEVCSAVGQCALDCGVEVTSCACALALCQGVDPDAARAWCDSLGGGLCGGFIEEAYAFAGCAPECGGDGKTMPGIGLLCEFQEGGCVEAMNTSMGLSLDCAACGFGCDPQCPEIANACGDDGCGGSCGDCPGDSECVDQQCKPTDLCEDTTTCECALLKCLGIELEEAALICDEGGDCLQVMAEQFADIGCDTQCDGAVPHPYPGLATLCEMPDCQELFDKEPDLASSCSACFEGQPCADSGNACECVIETCGLPADGVDSCQALPDACAVALAAAVDEEGCGELCDNNGWLSTVLAEACSNPACPPQVTEGTGCVCGGSVGSCLDDLSCGCVMKECTGPVPLPDVCESTVIPPVCQELIELRYEDQGGCGGSCADTDLPGLEDLCSTFDCVEAFNNAGLGALCEPCDSECLALGGCSGDSYCSSGDCVEGEYEGVWTVYPAGEPTQMAGDIEVELFEHTWTIWPEQDTGATIVVEIGPDPTQVDALIDNKVLFGEGQLSASSNPQFAEVSWEIWGIFEAGDGSDAELAPSVFTATIFATYHDSDGEGPWDLAWPIVGVR